MLMICYSYYFLATNVIRLLVVQKGDKTGCLWYWKRKYNLPSLLPLYLAPWSPKQKFQGSLWHPPWMHKSASKVLSFGHQRKYSALLQFCVVLTTVLFSEMKNCICDITKRVKDCQAKNMTYLRWLQEVLHYLSYTCYCDLSVTSIVRARGVARNGLTRGFWRCGSAADTRPNIILLEIW